MSMRNLIKIEVMASLFHFSEDPGITRFQPQVATTSTEAAPCVWAIDAEHAPSYWFPRDCPRACCWAGSLPVSEAGAALLRAGARRMHAVEGIWLQRMRETSLYVYEFDARAFEPKVPEAGYWVACEEVSPVSVSPVGDLLTRHVEAGIELRVVANLRPLIDAIVVSGLEFSIIRKSNALPRVVQ